MLDPDSLVRYWQLRRKASSLRMQAQMLRSAVSWYQFSAINVTVWACLAAFYLGREL